MSLKVKMKTNKIYTHDNANKQKSYDKLEIPLTFPPSSKH